MVENPVMNAKNELVDSLPKVLIYSVTAFVIWLFTKAVFVPLGDIRFYGSITAAKVIVAISTVTILLIIMKVMKEMKDIVEAISALLALSINPKAAPTEYEIYQKALKSLVYVIVVAVAFLFFGSLMNEIHPAISGIILVVVFIWAVGTLYSAGMMISEKIEAKAKKVAARIIEPGKK